MKSLADFALNSLTTYGPFALVLISYLGSLGIPFPNTIVIVAAGAFSRFGLLDWRLAMLACLVGAALADNSEYLLGRLAQTWLKQYFGERDGWQRAQATINHQGSWAIVLTRFWLTPLAPAVNVIAGSRYQYWRFLFFDVVGQFLWVLLYGGLGYFFAAQWELVSKVLGAFSGVSMVLLFLVFGSYFLVQHRRSKLNQG